ncbi:uncharacterized protein BCR38DRAFT_487145 [Pseudomassariella vexata]|uniref:Uncharacterized protein n=1 Tax=Pseudomassariella vexata TaxID=1141098 RepID=A0A1Y2DQ22_9PEZI|nr:uncharacterized protein BCR38DRAFT_487145 [Pseudomassariella vexata]ORY61393.1 hypothetical protein BCR38DRAFT_487145 [Pseudomassariella vexata]
MGPGWILIRSEYWVFAHQPNLQSQQQGSTSVYGTQLSVAILQWGKPDTTICQLDMGETAEHSNKTPNLKSHIITNRAAEKFTFNIRPKHSFLDRKCPPSATFVRLPPGLHIMIWKLAAGQQLKYTFFAGWTPFGGSNEAVGEDYYSPMWPWFDAARASLYVKCETTDFFGPAQPGFVEGPLRGVGFVVQTVDAGEAFLHQRIVLVDIDDHDQMETIWVERDSEEHIEAAKKLGAWRLGGVLRDRDILYIFDLDAFKDAFHLKREAHAPDADNGEEGSFGGDDELRTTDNAGAQK